MVGIRNSLVQIHRIEFTRGNVVIIQILCDRDSGRCSKLKKKDRLAELLYAPAASSAIRQFFKLFSTPFRSCQLHQTTFIYKGEDTE